MTETQAWPFEDADQHDPLAALRIPVTDAWPHHGYLAAYAGIYAVRAEPFKSWPRPDDDEATMLASYIGYQRSKYEPHAQARMLAEPLDTGDLSALVFVKRGAGDWAYRRAHWTEGVFWWPLPEGCDGGRKFTLRSLLYYVETDGGGYAPKWHEWVAAHPEAFPAIEEE